MFIQTAFSFSSVVQRWVCRFSGLRLYLLRQFHFSSAVPPRWRSAFSQLAPVAKFKLPVLASGSNISVKPTRILRSAYLARYIKGVAMWGSIFGALVEGIGGAAELRKEEEQKQRAFEKAMEDYSLNCRRCRNMAYPITGTPNRYRCSCGNQFAGPRHPL